VSQAPVMNGLPDAAVDGDARRPRIGIMVVGYNAATTLAKTLDRIPVEFRSRIAQVIVLDDASKDDTASHGQLWAQREDTAKTIVIRHSKNLGYGGNQKAGYAAASSGCAPRCSATSSCCAWCRTPRRP
jgi:glycosyltransferase involved in cell wall biosynthesis